MNKLINFVQNKIDNGIVPELYLDYNDRIHLSHYRLDSFTKEAIIDVLYEQFLADSVDIDCINSYIDYLLTLNPKFTRDDFKDEAIYELLEENIDYHIEDLFSKTSLNVYFFPNQQDNLNTEGGQLGSNIMNLFEEEDGPIEEPICPVLTELFTSQGYSFEDLKNPSLVQQSRFLTSFIEEVQNLSAAFCQLTVLTQMDLNTFFDIYDNDKTITVDETATLGLYDAACGGGSCLDIQLEKPFSFKIQKGDFEEFNFSRDFINYGFDIDEVYGLCDECWRGNFKID